MKYVYLILFNICAFYMLSVFTFGNGGILQNLTKIQAIQKLEEMKIKQQIELEEMKTRYNYLHSLNTPDFSTVASAGKKVQNMVIFKFIEKPEKTDNRNNNGLAYAYGRVFFSFGLVVLLLIAGNGALIWNIKRIGNAG